MRLVLSCINNKEIKMKILLYILFTFLTIPANENDSLTLSNIRNLDSLINTFIEIEEQDTIHFINEQYIKKI